MIELDLHDLHRRYQAGESLNAIARSVKMSGNGLKHRFELANLAIEPRLRAKGRFRWKTDVDVAEIVSLYQSGKSEQAISILFGVSRSVVRRCLLAQGVEIRGISDAQKLRMSSLSIESRLKLTASAHAAVRGVPQSEEHRCKTARTVEIRKCGVSENESLLGEFLKGLNVEFVPQKAVGRYNVDIALTESRVAVEVFGGGWHNSDRHAARFRPRIEYLLDRDWLPVIIWTNRAYPISIEAANQVVAIHQRRCNGESVGRHEHVIRGDGYLASVSQVKPDNGAIVLGFNPGNSERGEDGRFR